KSNQQPDASRPGTPSKPSFEERLRLPPGLPGSREEIKRLPPNLTEAERKAYYTRYYPRLPPLPPLPRPQPGPYGHPLTLPELQQLAMSNNPSLRQAAAAVQEAEGAAKQAGAYPNPSFGYEADNVGTGTTAGYQGMFIEQIIKTG